MQFTSKFLGGIAPVHCGEPAGPQIFGFGQSRPIAYSAGNLDNSGYGQSDGRNHSVAIDESLATRTICQRRVDVRSFPP